MKHLIQLTAEAFEIRDVSKKRPAPGWSYLVRPTIKEYAFSLYFNHINTDKLSTNETRETKRIQTIMLRLIRNNEY